MGEGQDRQPTGQRGCGSWKHMLMMVACCMVPLGLFVVFQKYGIEGSGYLMLLCPLMHFVMMRGMMNRRKEADSTEKNSG